MKKQKKKNRIKKFFSILLVAVFFTVALVILTPIFVIDSIEVYGNQYYKKEQILAVTNIAVGENGFKFLKGRLSKILDFEFYQEEKNIEKLPQIKGAIVKYIIPDKVKITVFEREGIAYLKYLGNNLIIDTDGYIIDIIKNSLEKKYIEIRGVNFDRYVLGEKLKTIPAGLMDIVIGFLQAVKKSDSKSNFKIFSLIDWIDVRESKSILFSLDGRFIIKIGDMSDIIYKLDFLRQIYFKNIRKNERGMIDFTRGQNPSFIPDN